MAIERASVPKKFLPDPGVVTSSLYEVMAANGCRPVRAVQRLRAAVAGSEDSRLLQIDIGAPVLVA
jgi:GntR family transcriptional regulator